MTRKVSPADAWNSSPTKRHSSKEKSNDIIDDGADANMPMNWKDQAIWIPQNFMIRECKKVCHCGRIYGDHLHEAKMKTHSAENLCMFSTTNAYGDAYCNGNVFKYIRVDQDTAMSNMMDLLEKVWGLDVPNLLISVTGGALNFQIKKKLKETFLRGLKKIASSTDAWIFTGGTNVGVMKLIGDAMKDFGVLTTSEKPVKAIGIATWGNVKNKSVLINKAVADNENWIANYSVDIAEEKDREKTIEEDRRGEKDGKKDESFLNPNHSHFILVDDGTEYQFGSHQHEISFRAKLEKEIVENRKTKAGKTVSFVLLVVGGGDGTLRTVYETIENKKPVVIINGSGRAADILARAYQNAKQSEKGQNMKKSENKPHNQEGNKTERTYEFCRDEDLVKWLKTEIENEHIEDHKKGIQNCLDNSYLMSVFDDDTKEGFKEIDVTMLQGLLKANKDNLMHQLHLALAWNRSDVAESDIFMGDKEWSTTELEEVMNLAMLHNKVDFVKLFLDQGFNLKKFLTAEKLLLLYRQGNEHDQPKVLKTIISKCTKGQAQTFLEEIGLLMQSLMKGAFKLPRYSVKEDDVTVNPEHELFIWSVLMLYQDMAKLFWTEIKDSMAAALVASSLLMGLKTKNENAVQVAKIEKYIEEWNNLAIGVLDECHATSIPITQHLLVRKQPNWGDSSCMMIAKKSFNKEFIFQPACQCLLNKIWMGKLAPDLSNCRLLLCVIFPILIWTCTLKFNRTKGDSPQVSEDNRPNRKCLVCKCEYTKERNETNEEKVKGNACKRWLWLCCWIFWNFLHAPVIIFMYNVVSYLVFLALFTYVLIFDNHPYLSTTEIVLIIWVLTLFLEEIRQIVMSSPPSCCAKLKEYFYTDLWNTVDIVAFVLFVISIGLRFCGTQLIFEIGKVFFALSFITFFVRLLHFFSVHNKLGPKLWMIFEMLQDLRYFLLILMVCVVSYAIASHSILYSNSPHNFYTFIAIIRRAFWNIYGELFLSDMENDSNCTDDDTQWMYGSMPPCPSSVGQIFVPIMMGIYMLLVNTLLLNLLIAMFSFTFNKIQVNSDKYGSFTRYSLIDEYSRCPVLCPPFIIIEHICILVKCCIRKYCIDHSNCFRGKFKNACEFVQWEFNNANTFQHKTKLQKNKNESMETKVNSIHAIMLDYKNHIDRTQEQQHQQKMPGQLNEWPPAIEKEMTKMQASRCCTDIHQQTELHDPDKPLQKAMNYENKQKTVDMSQIHSTQLPYIGLGVTMTSVPKDKVQWNVSFPEYSPNNYTAEEVLKVHCRDSDPDMMQMPVETREDTISHFNEFDPEYNCDRRSCVGKYEVKNGLPLNPMGRTGHGGRGLLYRWGPNHTQSIIVTRWKMNDNETEQMEGKPVLEFVAVFQSDNLPVVKATADCLIEDMLDNVYGTHGERSVKKLRRLKRLTRKKVKVSEGYLDDPRNTDNAWLETEVVNYHDDKGNILNKLNFRPSDKIKTTSWQTMTHVIKLQAPLLHLLKLVADKNGAYF